MMANQAPTFHDPALQDSTLQIEQLRALLLLSRELLRADDAGAVLELTGKALAQMVHMDSGLLVVRAEGSEYIVGYDRGGLARHADSTHPLYREGQACMSAGRPARAQPGEEDPAPRTALALCIPPDRPIATMVAAWERAPDAAAMRDRELVLSYIAELAVAALGKVQLRAPAEGGQWSQAPAYAQMDRDMKETEMRLLSLTDVMTGLRNRRGFFLEAEQTLKVAQRQHAQSAVIFADIDDMKRVNEELGQEAGDRLIRDAADIFTESFRSADVVARFGGDEFVAFTLDDDHPDVVLQRLRKNLHAFSLMEERPYRVSFSTGIVQCDPMLDRSLADYLQLADQQMYEQKRRRLH